MHPGPMNRGVEIAAEVADSARSTIVEQVANGVSVRMAVLYLLLGGLEVSPMTAESTTWLIRGARPLGGEPADIIIADGMIDRHRGRRTASRTGAQVLDAAGLIALPGPRRPAHPPARAGPGGRRDHRDRHPGRRAGRVHRGARDGQHRPGRRHRRGGRADLAARPGRPATATCSRSGRSPWAWAGRRLAELGAMADSAARVRVFSDDGRCVSDAVLMRRALEYVKAFDGVIAQHAQEPRLTEGAQMNEGVDVRRGSA